MSLKIGITGGIGSGKSIISNIFALYQIPIFNADLEAKYLMDSDVALKKDLVASFGSNIYTEGRLNRPFLAKLVFDNPEKLTILNSIVHPAVGVAYEKWYQNQNSAYTLKEAAILFESGSHLSLDYIIGVIAPEKLRIDRVMKRDNITEEAVKARMANQMDEASKMKLCHFVIHNDEKQSLILQVKQIHEQLIAIAK